MTLTSSCLVPHLYIQSLLQVEVFVYRPAAAETAGKLWYIEDGLCVGFSVREDMPVRLLIENRRMDGGLKEAVEEIEKVQSRMVAGKRSVDSAVAFACGFSVKFDLWSHSRTFATFLQTSA